MEVLLEVLEVVPLEVPEVVLEVPGALLEVLDGLEPVFLFFL